MGGGTVGGGVAEGGGGGTVGVGVGGGGSHGSRHGSPQV